VEIHTLNTGHGAGPLQDEASHNLLKEARPSKGQKLYSLNWFIICFKIKQLVVLAI